MAVIITSISPSYCSFIFLHLLSFINLMKININTLIYADNVIILHTKMRSIRNLVDNNVQFVNLKILCLEVNKI